MGELGLTTVQRRELEAILATQVPEARVVAFGSRARGDHRLGSDLDLLLEAQGRVPLQRLLDLHAALGESALPFRVDVVDGNAAAPAFVAAIRGGSTVILREAPGAWRPTSS